MAKNKKRFPTPLSSIAPASSTGSVDPVKLDAIHEILRLQVGHAALSLGALAGPLAQAILIVLNIMWRRAKASGVCFQQAERSDGKFQLTH